MALPGTPGCLALPLIRRDIANRSRLQVIRHREARRTLKSSIKALRDWAHLFKGGSILCDTLWTAHWTSSVAVLGCYSPLEGTRYLLIILLAQIACEFPIPAIVGRREVLGLLKAHCDMGGRVVTAAHGSIQLD